MSKRTIEGLGVFISSLFLFSVGLNHQEVIGFDSRFYLFALKMLQSGLDWFPSTYTITYPDYPATSTWIIYGLANLMGGINKFVAVLPTVIASAITLTMTYLLGALHDRRWGMSAVFSMLLSVAFIKGARSITLDMYVTMITVLCFYCIYIADYHLKPSWRRLAYPLLIVGFMFRGPIGLIIPAGVVTCYYLVEKNYYQCVVFAGMALLILSLCMVGLLATAYYSGGAPFMLEVMQAEIIGRFHPAVHPFYFYFSRGMSNYALTFPLALFVMGGVVWYQKKRQRVSADIDLLTKLIAWVLVIMVGMSLVGAKKTRYILPMAPALGLLMGYLFVAPERYHWFAFLRRWSLRLLLVLPSLFLIGIALIVILSNELTLFSLTKLINVLALLQVGSLISYYHLKHWRAHDMAVLSFGSAAFFLVYLFVIEPISLNVNTVHPFVAQIEKKRHDMAAKLVFYKENPDGVAIKYLINMPKTETPQFIADKNDLKTFTQRAFFIAKEANFKQLPPAIKEQFEVVDQSRIGRKQMFIFTQKS